MLPSSDCINYHVANRLHTVTGPQCVVLVSNHAETSLSGSESMLSPAVSFCVDLTKCAQSAN